MVSTVVTTNVRDVVPSVVPNIIGSPRGQLRVAAVGIDRYRTWNKLRNAVEDARGALRIFEKLGFKPIGKPLYDDMATRDALHRLVTDDLRALGPEDSLVLFFAGHGHTVTTPFSDGTPATKGYIIPVDADPPGGRIGTWLSLNSWLSDIIHLPPKHILVVLDACHSGIALDHRESPYRGAHDQLNEPLEQLRTRRSRRIITSALHDQVAKDDGPVEGHSLFTGCLIEALQNGLLAQTGQTVATGTQLGTYVQSQVIQYPGSCQTPEFGRLDYDDHGELTMVLSATLDQHQPAVLVVMGTKGGVGKGTFVSFASQLIAAAGGDVAIIDLDLAASGTTLAAEAYHKNTKPKAITTTFDHVAVKATNIEAYAAGTSLELWNITPDFLARIAGGRIWLVPARNPTTNGKDSFRVVANVLPVEQREDKLAGVIEDIIQRIRKQCPRITAILIDCGAERNLIYGAAFSKAHAGYILISAEPEHFGEFKAVRDELAHMYRTIDPDSIHAVGNQLTKGSDGPSLRNALRPIPLLGSIPNDPVLRDAKEKGLSTDVDLGHAEVAGQIAVCLTEALRGKKNIALNGIQIKHLPILTLVEHGQIQADSQHTIRRWRTTILPAILLTLVVIASVIYTLFIAGDTSHRMTSIGVMAAALLSGGVMLQLRRQRRRRRHQLVTELEDIVERRSYAALDDVVTKMRTITAKDRALASTIWRLVDSRQQHERSERANRR